MFTKVCTLFILSIQVLLLAWSGHSVYTYLVLKSSGMDFDFLVEIFPRDFQEGRLYNSSGDLIRYLNEDIAGNKNLNLIEKNLLREYEFINSLPINNKLPAWQIVSLYSAFPDIGIDYLRNVSWIQDVFVGDSQGLRHGKVKIGPVEIFEADVSFLYFIKKSRELLKLGNLYWGLRFFGYALHYLQDLMQPYHVRPGTVFELFVYPFDEGMRKKLRNLHTAYDRIMIYLILYDYEKLLKTINQAKPLHFRSDEELITEAFMYSYSKFFKIHELQKIIFSNFIEKRAPSLEDFAEKSKTKEFEELKEETYEIISTMSGIIKGLLLSLQLSYH
ncbi:MAG: hypothetical protein N2Z58_06470 [Fervidobacterium sp.]|nr:hypothetical protein [Fervidobacterium sp.]